MHLRSLVLFLLCVAGGARRSMRIAGSHQDAQQQNKLADDLEVSAEASEAWFPGVSTRGAVRPAIAWSKKPNEYDGAATFDPRYLPSDAQPYDEHFVKQAAIGERATLSTEGWETMQDSMDSVQNTLQEMTSSPQKLKESLERSPHVMFLARHVPLVATLVARPDEMAMDLAQSMNDVVEQMQEDLDDPAKRTEAIRAMESVLPQFAAAAQDPAVQELLVDMAEAEGEAAKSAVARSIAQLADLSGTSRHFSEHRSDYALENAPADGMADEVQSEAALRSALQKVNAARTLVPQMVAGGKRAVVAKKVAAKSVAKKPAAKSVAKKPAAKRPAAKQSAARRTASPAVKKSAAKRPAAKKPAARRTASSGVKKLGKTPIKQGDIGALPPLGIWDPLNLMTKMPDKYRRWQEMEIKHGRFAMAAVTHVLVTTAGFRWPGYLSYANDIKFADMPGGTLASWEALPGLAWAQIVLVVALLDNSVLAQDPKEAPGDVFAGGPWVRYEDEDVRRFKLNVERNNGRLAMMGIIGMIVNEALTGNPIWPIDIPPQPVLSTLADGDNAPAKVGSFILASLGMAFVGGIGAFNQFGKDGGLDEARMRGR